MEKCKKLKPTYPHFFGFYFSNYHSHSEFCQTYVGLHFLSYYKSFVNNAMIALNRVSLLKVFQSHTLLKTTFSSETLFDGLCQKCLSLNSLLLSKNTNMNNKLQYVNHNTL